MVENPSVGLILKLSRMGVRRGVVLKPESEDIRGVADMSEGPLLRGVASGFGVKGTWWRGVALSKPVPSPAEM